LKLVNCARLDLRAGLVFVKFPDRRNSLLFTMRRLCLCRRISVRAIKIQWRSANRVRSGPDTEIDAPSRLKNRLEEPGERFKKGATEWPVGMPGFLFPACIFRDPRAAGPNRPLRQIASERFDFFECCWSTLPCQTA
jgi:hypothetical protein